MKQLLVIFVFLLLMVQLVPAQKTTNQPLDEEVWQELAEDMDYTEEKTEKTDLDINAPKLNFDWSFFKYVFFFVVLGVLVYFLVKYLLGLQGNAAVKEAIQIEVNTLQEAEENPMQANLTQLIDKLISEGNYREATRAYFLLVLQRMYHNKLIEWKKPKTNFDYVREVADKPFEKRFSHLTTYFELIWYGKQPVAQADFQRIEPQFKKLLTNVSQYARQ